MRSSSGVKSAWVLICVCLALPAHAQSATIAVYSPTEVDPNTAPQMSTVTYVNVPRQVEHLDALTVVLPSTAPVGTPTLLRGVN